MAEQYKGAVSATDYGGVVLYDNKPVADTVQCGHCGQHWVPVKGSGTIRGFCCRCMKRTCGPKCPLHHFGCVPFELYLEILEGKIAIGNIPIVVSVPRSVGE